MIGVNEAVVEGDGKLEHEGGRVKELLRLCGARRCWRCRDGRRVKARQGRNVDENVDDLSYVVLDGRFELVQGAEAEEGALRSGFELHHNRHLSLKYSKEIIRSSIKNAYCHCKMYNCFKKPIYDIKHLPDTKHWDRTSQGSTWTIWMSSLWRWNELPTRTSWRLSCSAANLKCQNYK